MSGSVRCHYERYPYPRFPLLASVRSCDTYALNLTALWTRFNGQLPPESAQRILIAGCGSFSPYPFSVANPAAEISALDLSASSLRRARLHCLLHGRRNINYHVGDLLDERVAAGRFGLIDAYGVLHHLNDPLAGLKSLEARLASGGILRLMVYNRYARREEESIRRAFRMLGIRDASRAQALIKRAPKGSRLRAYAEASDEAEYEAGLADALLHPCVSTFRIDELLDLIRHTGLKLLRFAQYGALEHVDEEVERIRRLEAGRQSCGNFLVYLGHNTNQDGCAGRRPEDTRVVLNPCLRRVVGPFWAGTLRLPPRFGFENPSLGWRERRFLSLFRSPVALRSLDSSAQAAVSVYNKALMLLQYHE